MIPQKCKINQKIKRNCVINPESYSISPIVRIHCGLKLVCANSNDRVLNLAPPFFFQMIIFSIYLLLRMNIMLDFICIWPIDQSGAHRKRQIQNEKLLPRVGLEEICSLVPFRLSYPGFHESFPINVTFLNTCNSDTNVQIAVSSRMMKYNVFCLVYVLYCVTYGNISILDNMQKDWCILLIVFGRVLY